MYCSSLGRNGLRTRHRPNVSRRPSNNLRRGILRIVGAARAQVRHARCGNGVAVRPPLLNLHNAACDAREAPRALVEGRVFEACCALHHGARMVGGGCQKVMVRSDL